MQKVPGAEGANCCLNPVYDAHSTKNVFIDIFISLSPSHSFAISSTLNTPAGITSRSKPMK